MALLPSNYCGKCSVALGGTFGADAHKDYPNFCKECGKAEEKEDALRKELEKIIITTTYSVDGYKVSKYLGVISAEIVMGVDVFKDIGASFRDFLGGRSKGYETELKQGKDDAIDKLKYLANELGADAVIGVDLDYSEVRGTMFMLVANGTAVKLSKNKT